MDAPIAVFDLDNTLIDRADLFRRWAAHFVAQHRLDAADLEWLEEQDGDGLVPKDQFFDTVRKQYGIATPVATMVEAYYRDYPEFTPPPSQRAVYALHALKDEGWRVAVVTNGPPFQERVLDASGLRSIVDAALVSATVGVRKPNREIFEMAAKAAGATLEGAWMIGDSAAHDVLGALNAGMRSIWLRRDRQWTETAYTPTLIADSIPEAVTSVLDAA